jgi:hypothetical protein
MRRVFGVSCIVFATACSSATTSSAPDSAAPTDSSAATDATRTANDGAIEATTDSVVSDTATPFDVVAEVPKPTGDAADATASDTVVVSEAPDAVADSTIVADIAADAASKPFKGIAGDNACTDMATLKVSWWYNWTQSPGNCTTKPFVPMVWGHANEQSSGAITSALSSFVTNGDTEVLGFNEPDNSTQSNLTEPVVFGLWPAFDNASLRVGSPATSANAAGQTWFQSFMAAVNGDTTSATKVDFLAIHWYGWNAGSCDAAAASLESYIKTIEAIAGNRPIWITEFGCMNASNPDAATVQAFFEGALAMFAKHPRIERYAWFQWNTNNELFNDSGLTPLGVVYANAPSTH